MSLPEVPIRQQEHQKTPVHTIDMQLPCQLRRLCSRVAAVGLPAHCRTHSARQHHFVQTNRLHTTGSIVPASTTQLAARMGTVLTPDTTLYPFPPRAALLEPASFAAGLSKSVGKKKMFSVSIWLQS